MCSWTVVKCFGFECICICIYASLFRSFLKWSKKPSFNNLTYTQAQYTQAHHKMKENFYFSSIRREMQLFKNSFLFQIYQRKNYYKIQNFRITVCKIVAKQKTKKKQTNKQTCKKLKDVWIYSNIFFYLKQIEKLIFKTEKKV